MAFTALFSLPFSTLANSYSIYATTVVYVSNFEELRAALTDGQANKTIVLTDDIKGRTVEEYGYTYESYDWCEYDEYGGFVKENPDEDLVIEPNVNGNVVIDMNGHNINLGKIQTNASYSSEAYTVDHPRMFLMSAPTDLYIINTVNKNGKLSLSSNNICQFVYFKNSKASFNVIADSSHPVTISVADPVTNESIGSSIVKIETDNGTGSCEKLQFIGGTYTVDSYNGQVLNFGAASSMNTPTYIGGNADFSLERQGGRLVYTKNKNATAVKLYSCNVDYGTTSQISLFKAEDSSVNTVALNTLFDNSYNYTVTGANKSDDVYSIAPSSRTLTLSCAGSSSPTPFLSSANAHYSVKTDYSLYVNANSEKHNKEVYTTKEPTCTETGSILYKCTVCDQYFEEIIPASHVPQEVPYAAATCTAAGNLAHYKCTVCGKLFNDEKATQEITADSVTIAKIAHDFSGNAQYCKYGCGTANPAYVAPAAQNKITVTLKKVTVKKSAKKLVLTATVKKNGKAVSGKKVTFRFNGKKYTAKTNNKGVAKVTVKKAVLKKLKVGKKVKITATWSKVTAKKTVKVKK